MKKLQLVLVLLLLSTVQLSAQEIYNIDIVNPCTGEMETYSGSIDERGDTIYVTYTLFGNSREFNTDNPNWINDAIDWMLEIIEQESDCGPAGEVTQASFEPTTNTVMNSTVRTIRNELFTMDISPPRSSEERPADPKYDDNGDESEEDEEEYYYKEVNLGTGIKSYKYDDFEGTATNYGADYIGLFRLRQIQVGINVDAIKLNSSNDEMTSTRTLWGLRFKKSSYSKQNKKRSTAKTTLSILDAKNSDFGGAFSLVKTGKRLKDNGGMLNTGFAVTVSLQSFNDYATGVFNNGYVFGFMSSTNFSERISGSINGLLLGNLNVNGTAFGDSDQTELQILIGGNVGGSLFVNLFKGAGLQANLSYTPSSFIFTFGEIVYETAGGFGPSETQYYDSVGFYGASSLSFDVGFAYRF